MLHIIDLKQKLCTNPSHVPMAHQCQCLQWPGFKAEAENSVEWKWCQDKEKQQTVVLVLF